MDQEFRTLLVSLKNKTRQNNKNQNHQTVKGWVPAVRDLSHGSLEEVPVSIVSHSLVIMKQSKRNKPGFVLFGSLVSFSFVVVVDIGIVCLVWVFWQNSCSQG